LRLPKLDETRAVDRRLHQELLRALALLVEIVDDAIVRRREAIEGLSKAPAPSIVAIRTTPVFTGWPRSSSNVSYSMPKRSPVCDLALEVDVVAEDVGVIDNLLVAGAKRRCGLVDRLVDVSRRCS
jgi:hypothetical protein